jgi:hypothetical protein
LSGCPISDVVRPELETVRVRLAVQQVVIMLMHERRFIVNGIAGRLDRVVDNPERGRRLGAQAGAASRVREVVNMKLSFSLLPLGEGLVMRA